MDMTEPELHAHPDYVALEKVEASWAADFTAAGSAEAGVAIIARIGDPSVLLHFSVHRSYDVLGRWFPAAMIEDLLLPFTALWRDAFLTGVRFQAHAQSHLATLTIPDTPEGL